MIKRGWLSAADSDANELEKKLCSFFGVSSLTEVPHMAHAAKRSDVPVVPASQLAWLFRVRQIASEMVVPGYTKERLASAIEKIKLMLEAPEEIRHVPRLLQEAGVRFVIVEGLPGSRIDGVCLWLDQRSPVIGLSLRFDRIDNFWFVLLHECAHVLNGHGKDEPIIDVDLDAGADSVLEEERIANEMAAEFLVPQVKMKSFYERKKPFFAERDVVAFAKIMRVHPGLVVGQLQRMLGRYDLLRRYLVPIRNHIGGAALVDGWGDIIPVES
jgi:HTH-type transcriptional regulator/antitoxin HigA